ncbi:MAG: oligopeptide ABC transporter ATP-binding protein OppD, partial [Pseudomonadales bacterium]|nr:oligopeptide ABC transporter ATP-binding protein OppD [Pseudomonadales bacterium]
AEELYANPKHPYTVGLMASIPGIEGDAGARLITIDGQPPDLADLPPGCAFATRCQHAHDACRASIPALDPVERNPSHRSACFGYPL